jgi:hypothetical protein
MSYALARAAGISPAQAHAEALASAHAVGIEELRPYRLSSLKPVSVTIFPVTDAMIGAKAAMRLQAF